MELQKELNESKFRKSLHFSMAKRSFVSSIYKLAAKQGKDYNKILDDNGTNNWSMV